MFSADSPPAAYCMPAMSEKEFVMNRLVWSLLIAGALSLVSVPEASAHGNRYASYDRHTVVRYGESYPYWLRRNVDFGRWYLRSHYRHDLYLGWDRLFEIYRYERKYHRLYRHYDRRGRHRYREHHRHH